MAKCKDLKVINNQFRLIINIKVNYKITNKDIYNFNKLGFIISVVLTELVKVGLTRQLEMDYSDLRH